MTRAFGCGKVILFGEHSVVYGQPALAAGLDVGIQVTEINQDADALCVSVTPWGTETRPDDGTRLGDALARICRVVAQRCGGPAPPARIELHATVPVGAGLGSSAALAVALARHLIAHSPKAPDNPDEVILAAALASEEVFHGNPSGVDHTTSTLGGILDYQRHRQPRFIPLDVSPVPLIIAQMAPGGDTGELVAGVRARYDAERAATEHALALLGQLAIDAQEALRGDDLPRLGRLMDMAHGGLMTIGVSTPALDRGCHVAREAGAWGAKLTGAGGGGCIIAVGPVERHGAILEALQSAGALRAFATLAGAPATALDDANA